MTRLGLFATAVSIRCQTTSIGSSASELSETNTRPGPVGAPRVVGGVRVAALGPRRRAARPVAPQRRCQPGRRSAADGDEIAARRLGSGGGELGAVRFEEFAVAAPVLRSPDAHGT